ncbi:hypothetical protein KM043_005590 [Ampulex compressa]|nr:hypothetical protein KM043_005590 [Ampulex compressa]
MIAKHVPVILAAVLLQAGLIAAGPPDWVPQEMLAMVQGDKERCMAEYGTTQDQIDKVNEGVLVNEKSISCYMYCLLDAFSLADEEGNLESEMLMSFVPEHLVATASDILGKCAKQEGPTACDKIFEVAKCVQSTVPELWFIV